MVAQGNRGLEVMVCIAALLVGAAVDPAYAQCAGGATSCVQCHEMQASHSVLSSPQAWHRDHAFGDLCASCHGGRPDAADRATAHAGLRDPLSDPSTSCAPCHVEDSAPRAELYAAQSIVAPAVSEKSQPPGPGANARATSLLDRLLSIMALALGVVVAGMWLGGDPRGALRRARWSPYVTGVGLGVTLSVAMVAFGRPLSVSAAFDELAMRLGRALAPSDRHFARPIAPELSWNVWLVIGLLGGAFLSAALSRSFRVRSLPDERWNEVFGDRVWVRWLVAFTGATLVQLGAGIAGGCTSGLAISGGAVMAPAAFLFMLGMFAGGIPTALLVYSRKRGIK